MKENKILRKICYILLPIIVLVFIFSTLYIVVTNEYEYSSRSEYFKSKRFMDKYIYGFESIIRDLIFAKEQNYSVTKDGNYKILYKKALFGPYVNLKDFYYLVIYQNKAMTNVKITEQTCTIEGIKEYILSENNNKQFFYVENGNYDSSVEELKQEASNYSILEGITFNYYTIQNNDNTIEKEKSNNDINNKPESQVENNIVIGDDEITEEIEEIDDKEIKTIEKVTGDANIIINQEDDDNVTIEEYFQEDDEDESSLNNAKSDLNGRIYHKAKFKDFKIYSSYIEDFNENTDMNLMFEILEEINNYSILLYVAEPISLILILLLIFYVINSVGSSNNDEIKRVNTFDKIPLEILVGIFCIIIAISFIIVDEMNLSFKINNFYNIISIFISLYVLNFTLLEIIAISIIRRVKSKDFLNTCIIGKTFLLFKKIVNTIINKVLKEWVIKCKRIVIKCKNELLQNFGITVKISIIGICLFFSIISIFIIAPYGILITMLLFEYIIYKIVTRINSFKKLEKELKKIYEGDTKTKLNPKDFTEEFKEIVYYINDISNGFEKAVDESIKSEKLKTELITNVSHDIKTPLTSIINYVDLLKNEQIENDKAREYIGILDSKSQRLKKLIEDLVEASKASSGNIKLELNSINLVELVKQAEGEFEDKFKEKKLEIINNFGKGKDEHIMIKADSRYMYRVIENLFSNISKYALDNSRVYIDLDTLDNKIYLVIKNISKEKLNITEEELMQRFVRGDKSRSTDGNGLGLAISKSLVEIQGGKLECKIDGDLFKIEIEMDRI